MLVAAAAAVAIVVGAVVATRTRDGSVELVPSDDVGAAALGGEDLVAELAGRRWVALERFDDPSPTVLTSDVLFTGTADSLELVGHDGCNDYGGPFSFDGSSVVSSGFESETDECDADVLAIESGHRIELTSGDTTFSLRSDDGRVIAQFTDYDTLELAEPEIMPYGWYADDLEFVEFTATGRGIAMFCTVLAWEDQGDRIVVTMPDPDDHRCSGFEDENGEIDFSTVATELRELTTKGAEVRRIPTGLMLAGERGAIQLLALPAAEVDPTGVTIAAGALFGVEPGVGVTPDALIDAAAPVLGTPDDDTGWLDRRSSGDANRIQTCGLNEYREIRWGDLVAGFRGSGSRTVLMFWYVGDPRTIGMITPDIDRPRVSGPSGLTTEHGVGVGDPIDDLPDRINISRVDWDAGNDARFDESDAIVSVTVISANPRKTPSNLEPGILGGSYLSIDGTVVGFGAETTSC